MLFDTTLQVSEVGVEAGSDYVELTLHLAMPIPISASQAMMLPLGVFRIPLSKDGALEHGQKLLDEGHSLPDDAPAPTSDLVIATSMAGVDQAAQSAAKMRQGNPHAA